MTVVRDLDLDLLHAGDEALFDQLVRAYSGRLRLHVRRYATDVHDELDLLQEVWLRAYRKRHTYDGRGSVFGWLLTVTRTVGMEAVTKRRRQPHTEVLRDVAVEGSADAVLLRDTLHDALLALTDRQRAVVLLRLVDGLSTAETAQQLQCAPGTVKATLHQATRKLQALLNEATV